MGSPPSEAMEPEFEGGRSGRERPQHEVMLAKPFAVSKFEVTFDDWDACTSAGACPDAPDSWGRGRMPVINVSWVDAKKYVGWLSQLTGKEYYWSNCRIWTGLLGTSRLPDLPAGE